MRFPFVKRSRLDLAAAGARASLDTLRAKYDLVWRDHLARCDCHDSWDQCPCTEVGHKEPLAEGQSIYDCANKCCRWC